MNDVDSTLGGPSCGSGSRARLLDVLTNRLSMASFPVHSLTTRPHGSSPEQPLAVGQRLRPSPPFDPEQHHHGIRGLDNEPCQLMMRQVSSSRRIDVTAAKAREWMLQADVIVDFLRPLPSHGWVPVQIISDTCFEHRTERLVGIPRSDVDEELSRDGCAGARVFEFFRCPRQGTRWAHAGAWASRLAFRRFHGLSPSGHSKQGGPQLAKAERYDAAHCSRLTCSLERRALDAFLRGRGMILVRQMTVFRFSERELSELHLRDGRECGDRGPTHSYRIEASHGRHSGRDHMGSMVGFWGKRLMS